MKSHYYSKQETKEGMQIGTKYNNKEQLKEEPHLSGAYIRSLVKQLTSSRTKEYPNSTTMDHPKDDSDSSSSVVVDSDCFPGQQNLTKLRGVLSETQQGQQAQRQQQQQQPHKKQVRRRLHTSRPYQERLLNMAEARREIVTALKFHRAAMKQAQEQQQQQQQQKQLQDKQTPQPLNPPIQPCFDEANTKPRTYQTINHQSTTHPNFSNYLDNLPYSSFPYPPPSQPSHFWPVSPISPLPSVESLSFILPNQPLGLNLNFQDFDNLSTTTLYHSGNNNNNNPSIYSSSSPSSSAYSPTLSAPADQGIPPECSHAVVGDVSESGSLGGGGGGVHQVVDDEEMAEIKSLGEQHQMEWNDTVNLMTSAWWFKFLKSMDIGPELKAEEEDDCYQPFDQVMEIPSWLNAPDCSLQQHLNDCFSKDYFQESALPCMDIEEIEGIDGEWLS